MNHSDPGVERVKQSSYPRVEWFLFGLFWCCWIIIGYMVTVLWLELPLPDELQLPVNPRMKNILLADLSALATFLIFGPLYASAWIRDSMSYKKAFWTGLKLGGLGGALIVMGGLYVIFCIGQDFWKANYPIFWTEPWGLLAFLGGTLLAGAFVGLLLYIYPLYAFPSNELP